MPLPPPQPVRAAAARPAIDQIGAFNASHDLHALLASYDARRATHSLFYCPFHPDTHASLRVFIDGGQQYAQCLSRNSDCPLAAHRRNEAFNVYCIGEGLDARAALHRWQRDSLRRV